MRSNSSIRSLPILDADHLLFGIQPHQAQPPTHEERLRHPVRLLEHWPFPARERRLWPVHVPAQVSEDVEAIGPGKEVAHVHVAEVSCRGAGVRAWVCVEAHVLGREVEVHPTEGIRVRPGVDEEPLGKAVRVVVGVNGGEGDDEDGEPEVSCA